VLTDQLTVGTNVSLPLNFVSGSNVYVRYSSSVHKEKLRLDLNTQLDVRQYLRSGKKQRKESWPFAARQEKQSEKKRASTMFESSGEHVASANDLEERIRPEFTS
jgi:hypothetical protein